MATTEEVAVLPAGVELPDGVVLTFCPHRACPCADCRAAFEALDAGELEVPESGDVEGVF